MRHATDPKHAPSPEIERLAAHKARQNGAIG